MKMKIYKVDFSPMWPVPSGLIIAAPSMEMARIMAENTIKHTKQFSVEEVSVIEPSVIFYESGDY